MLIIVLVIASCKSPADRQQSDGSVSSADSLVSSTSGDRNPSASKGDSLVNNSVPDDPEQEVRTRYADIIRLKNVGQLDSTFFKYSCDGEKSGRLTYYSNKGKLKMIAHAYSEYDHFTSTDQYFVEGDQLYFIYQNSVTWSFESGPEGSTKDNIVERRVYLKGGKPFKCLEKKYTVRSQASNNPRSEQVSNKVVDCSWGPIAEKEFKLLARYYNKPAPECLK